MGEPELALLTASMWFELGLEHQQRKQHTEAITHYLRAAKLAPEYPFTYLNLSTNYIALGQYEKAADALNRAIQIDSTLADAWYTLGLLHTEAGNDAESVSAFQQAVDLSPDDPEAHLSLARAYQKIGRVEEAIREYRRCLSLNPSNSDARMGLNALLQK